MAVEWKDLLNRLAAAVEARAGDLLAGSPEAAAFVFERLERLAELGWQRLQFRDQPNLLAKTEQQYAVVQQSIDNEIDGLVIEASSKSFLKGLLDGIGDVLKEGLPELLKLLKP